MAATELDSSAVETLAAGMRGAVIRPGDASYDDARALYNAMIDKRPALIARCVDVADVIAAVDFAPRAAASPIAIRGGGHNGAGLGSVDDGLVIDLSAMNGGPRRPGRTHGARRRRRAAGRRRPRDARRSAWPRPAASSRRPASAA